MDEVFGDVPPSAAPPAKKPILTILKQARAFGIGMVLSTQNPVDLDYKALSNAGTWMIGRLQTERDVDRLRDGLQAASGSVDAELVRTTIAGLGKREFVLHSTTAPAPAVFTTRWALDYLAGPLTKDQVGALPGQATAAPPAAATTTSTGSTTPVEERPVEVGGDPSSTRHRAGLAVRVSLLFDETKADLRHTEEFECVLVGLGEHLDPAELVTVDYDDRDLREAAPTPAVYELPAAPIGKATWFRDAKAAVVDHLHAERTVTVLRNAELELWSRPGESAEDFAVRCRAAGEEAAEAKTLELVDREAELVDDFAEIEAGWADVADQVEEVEVGLEKNDIDVRQLALIWVPT
jgi:hypothetical protein